MAPLDVYPSRQPSIGKQEETAPMEKNLTNLPYMALSSLTAGCSIIVFLEEHHQPSGPYQL
jgi:hypothetical protein